MPTNTLITSKPTIAKSKTHRNRISIEVILEKIETDFAHERFANLCGPYNDNLKQIEKYLNVEIYNRSNIFQIVGEKSDVAKAEKALKALYKTTKNREHLTAAEVHLCLQDINANSIINNVQLNDNIENNIDQKGKDDDNDKNRYKNNAITSVITATGHKTTANTDEHKTTANTDNETNNTTTISNIVIKTPKITITPRGKNQINYLKNILKNDINFSIGPAGTGKTYLAVACAIIALLKEEVERIVLVRPVVEAGEHLGFLPGDIAQKIDPYLRPLYDALYDMLGAKQVEKLLAEHAIEIAPLAFMRGRTLNASFIILDESQNSTQEQMQMFLTRTGFGSKVVITGDITQIDLAKGKQSGLIHAMQILKDIQGISFNFFEASDVVRHPLVQRIVQAYAQNKA